MWIKSRNGSKIQLFKFLCYTFIFDFHIFSVYYLTVSLFQFERDVMVWNNKQYLSQPLLVAEDRFILRFRRWYSQFYSENSPKFSFQKESLEWQQKEENHPTGNEGQISKKKAGITLIIFPSTFVSLYQGQPVMRGYTASKILCCIRNAIKLLYHT